MGYAERRSRGLSIPGLPPGTTAHAFGECRVFVGIEDDRWHLSIAHPRRLPTWDELRDARYRFVPDAVVMAMLLPPKADYVNYHLYCFHLWEIRGEEAWGHAPILRPLITLR